MDAAVIIPCYNAEPWVGETIESVLSQRTQPAQIIAVNDGSTDRTPEILSRFSARIDIVHQENQGLGAARNAGAARARTRWLAFLDADDLYKPDAIAGYSDLHQRFPQADVLFSDFEVFDETGRTSPRSALQHLRDLADYSKEADDDAYLLAPPTELLVARNGAFTPSCLVVDRRTFAAVGCFDECRESQGAEDLELYFKLLPSSTIAFVDRALVRKRWHSTNMSINHRRMRAAGERALTRADVFYQGRHRELLPIVRRKRAGLMASWARSDVEARRLESLQTTADLLRLTPLDWQAWWLLMRAVSCVSFTSKAKRNAP